MATYRCGERRQDKLKVEVDNSGVAMKTDASCYGDWVILKREQIERLIKQLQNALKIVKVSRARLVRRDIKNFG